MLREAAVLRDVINQPLKVRRRFEAFRRESPEVSRRHVSAGENGEDMVHQSMWTRGPGRSARRGIAWFAALDYLDRAARIWN